jgi:hypothetical protein
MIEEAFRDDVIRAPLKVIGSSLPGARETAAISDGSEEGGARGGYEQDRDVQPSPAISHQLIPIPRC